MARKGERTRAHSFYVGGEEKLIFSPPTISLLAWCRGREVKEQQVRRVCLYPPPNPRPPVLFITLTLYQLLTPRPASPSSYPTITSVCPPHVPPCIYTSHVTLSTVFFLSSKFLRRFLKHRMLLTPSPIATQRPHHTFGPVRHCLLPSVGLAVDLLTLKLILFCLSPALSHLLLTLFNPRFLLLHSSFLLLILGFSSSVVPPIHLFTGSL